MLTKLEELILLSVIKLADDAYGKSIFQLIRSITGKNLSLGGVYFPLERLVKKGLLEQRTGEITEERRGFSKRYYHITGEGMAALAEIKWVNDQMWQSFPEIQSPVMEKE